MLTTSYMGNEVPDGISGYAYQTGPTEKPRMKMERVRN